MRHRDACRGLPSGRSPSRFRDIATEVLKPLEQTADGLGFVLLVEVFAAQVVVLGAVAQHVELALGDIGQVGKVFVTDLFVKIVDSYSVA